MVRTQSSAKEQAAPAPAGTATAGADAATQEATGDGAIVFESRVGIAHVGALHERMCKAAEHDGEVVLDASEVQVLDAAVLQLIVVHVQALRARGMQPTWNGVSEAFGEAARLLGLADGLGLPS